MKITMTATRMRDADAIMDFAVWRCDLCRALLSRDDVDAHFAWHSTLLHTSPAAQESARRDDA